MRIGLVTETYPPDVNGVAATLHRLARGLVDRGHGVHVVRPRRDRQDFGRHDEGIDEWAVPGLPLPGYPGLRFGLPATRRLYERWQALTPTVVHVATEGPLGWSAVQAARQAALPTTSSFHTQFHLYSSHYRIGMLRAAGIRYLRTIHNRTLRTFVPSDSMYEELRGQGFLNLQLLGRGVDARLFSPDRRSADLRRQWGVTGDEIVALYVGRVAPEKNIPLAIAAYAAIRERAPGIRLVVVGDGPMLRDLKRRHPDIAFAGLRRGEDLAAHYASADLFLFPSTTETFGNVVPEAMASGLLVLAFDYAAAAELIQTNVNGYTVPLGDAAGYVGAARQLLDCQGRWPVMRHNARQTATKISWDVVVDEFEAHLESVTRR